MELHGQAPEQSVGGRNLHIATDRFSRPLVSDSSATIRNLSNRAVDVLVYRRWFATRTYQALWTDSARQVIPASAQGGSAGVALQFFPSPHQLSALDSLAIRGMAYGVVIVACEVLPVAGVPLNLAAREWFTGLRADSSQAFSLASVVGAEGLKSTCEYAFTGALPTGWHFAGSTEAGGEGHYSTAVFRGITGLPLGAGIRGQLRITRCEDRGFPIREVSIVRDSVKPTIWSYRIVVFDDQMLGIQVEAQDAFGDIEPRGVQTVYSVDGSTWLSALHREEPGGVTRPKSFRVFLGPFPAGTRLLIGVSVRDASGNVQTSFPSGAAMMIAPSGSSSLREARRAFLPSGIDLAFGLDDAVDVWSTGRSVNAKPQATHGTDSILDAKRASLVRTLAERFRQAGFDRSVRPSWQPLSVHHLSSGDVAELVIR